jgi:hypothetical protein
MPTHGAHMLDVQIWYSTMAREEKKIFYSKSLTP